VVYLNIFKKKKNENPFIEAIWQRELDGFS
jgi:hypothetical protein